MHRPASLFLQAAVPARETLVSSCKEPLVSGIGRRRDRKAACAGAFSTPTLSGWAGPEATALLDRAFLRKVWTTWYGLRSAITCRKRNEIRSIEWCRVTRPAPFTFVRLRPQSPQAEKR